MRPEDFPIAIITALPVEFACMQGMLDEKFDDLPQSAQDKNAYTYGKIAKHNVVLACLPFGVTGLVSAASVAGRILHSFPNLRFGLMVGIGGGVPDMETDEEHDIRLGDIVVSKPSQTFGGVVQYNMGKSIPGSRSTTTAAGEDSRTNHNGAFERTGSLNKPPDELLAAVSKLEAKHQLEYSDVSRFLSEMLEKYPKMQQTHVYQGAEQDILFEAAYDHQGTAKTCKSCDTSRIVDRPARDQLPAIHYGTIASDSQVMRHGVTRDRIAAELDALCFEMEAAGLMDNFPCLVIRGICDYADSHKNKRWQPYAAAVAAAYAKELLHVIPMLEKKPSSQSAAAAGASSTPGTLNQIFGGIHNTGSGQQLNNASGTFHFGSQDTKQRFQDMTTDDRPSKQQYSNNEPYFSPLARRDPSETLNSQTPSTNESLSKEAVLTRQSFTQDALSRIMSSTTSVKGLLYVAVVTPSSDLLSLLVQERPEMVEETFPWIADLLDESLDSNEIGDLIIKSEHLHWIDDGSFVRYSAQSDPPIPNLHHLERCIHSSCSGPISEVLRNLQNGQIASSTADASFAGISMEPSSPEDMGSRPAGIPSWILNSTEILSLLEDRERHLISICGIGGVFPPFIGGKNPGKVVLKGVLAQIIYGDLGQDLASTQLIAANNLKTPSVYALFNEIQQLENKTGREVDTEIKTLPSYNIPYFGSSTLSRAANLYDNAIIARAFEKPTAHESEYKPIIETITNALENVLQGLRFLQEERQVCERITILVRPISRTGVVVAKSIMFDTLLEMHHRMRICLKALESEVSYKTKRLVGLCFKILHDLQLGDQISFSLNFRTGKPFNTYRCLQVAALVVQIVSVGIVTYVRGHSREFFHTCLSRPIEAFLLQGFDSEGPLLCVERLELACFGQMLGRSVWVFHEQQTNLGQSSKKYPLSTSIPDLLGTWGGELSSNTATPERFELNIGRGVIVSPPRAVESRMAYTRQSDEMLCHWTDDPHDQNPLNVPPAGVSKLLIGTITVGNNCRLQDANDKVHEALLGRLVPLGTWKGRYKREGRNIAVTGGQYATITAGYSQVWDDGSLLKERIMKFWTSSKDLNILRAPWGLQISLCTGISRRVPLRSLYSCEVLPYLAAYLKSEWNIIGRIAARFSEVSHPEFDLLLNGLTSRQYEIFQKATDHLLGAMEFTGVKKDGKKLIAWWPEPGVFFPRGIELSHRDCAEQDCWIPMIQDSLTCAAFTLLTTKCLEDQSVSVCRHPVTPLVYEGFDKLFLNTYLTPVNKKIGASQIKYCVGKKLRISQRSDRVLVAAIHNPDTIHLDYVYSSIPVPHIVLRRLDEVREQQELRDAGQDVFIL